MRQSLAVVLIFAHMRTTDAYTIVHLLTQYGQIMFAYELVASGDYAPVHIPPVPALYHAGSASEAASNASGWGAKHGEVPLVVVREIERMVKAADFVNITVHAPSAPRHGTPLFSFATNTIMLRRSLNRVNRHDQLHLSLEDRRGVALATSVLPL